MGATYLGNKLVNAFFDDNLVATLITKKPITFTIDWLILGGGGSGGSYGNQDTGGGGAGRFVSGSFQFTTGQTITINYIGPGGAAVTSTINNSYQGNNGGETYFNFGGIQYLAPGGGGGAQGIPTVGVRNGRPGGSGGGASYEGVSYDTFGGAAEEGDPIAGFGFPGENGQTAYLRGSGGGGAGGAPFGGINGLGGPSKLWFNGVNYCAGGAGGRSYYEAPFNPAQNGFLPGDGGQGAPFWAGFGPQPSGAGSNGLAIFRYFGSPILTGGTISELDGYTYHTFTEFGLLE